MELFTEFALKVLRTVMELILGTVNGISTKLEHIKDIGANVIWLSPIYTRPMQTSCTTLPISQKWIFNKTLSLNLEYLSLKRTLLNNHDKSATNGN